MSRQRLPRRFIGIRPNDFFFIIIISAAVLRMAFVKVWDVGRQILFHLSAVRQPSLCLYRVSVCKVRGQHTLANSIKLVVWGVNKDNA